MKKDNNMKINTIIIALGFIGFLGTKVSPELPKDMRRWILEMHLAQVELLKIEWGQPGFCTEWDSDYSAATRSCGKRGRIIQRRTISSN